MDSKVVALDDEGRPNFNLLQHSVRNKRPIYYFVFDMLICEDRQLTRLLLRDRRELLKRALKPTERVHISEQFGVSAKDSPAAIQSVSTS